MPRQRIFSLHAPRLILHTESVRFPLFLLAKFNKMLLCDRTTEINQHRIYPYIHSFSNASSRSDILQSILVPDVLPSSIPSGTPFSLVAGMFCLYNSTEAPS